ncbi:12374_t:CDS:2, partial [Racocetra persica]
RPPRETSDIYPSINEMKPLLKDQFKMFPGIGYSALRIMKWTVGNVIWCRQNVPIHKRRIMLTRLTQAITNYDN